MPEDEADEAVGGHEGEVDFGDVGGGDEGLFDDEEEGGEGEADPVEGVEVAGDADGEEGGDGEAVAEAGEGKGFGAAEGGGDGFEIWERSKSSSWRA